MEWVIRLVSNVRTARSEANVPAGAKIPALIESAAGSTRARLQRHGDLANRLARLDGIEETSDPAPKGSVQAIVDEATIILPLDDIIDKDAERARLTKDITKCEKKSPGWSASFQMKASSPKPLRLLLRKTDAALWKNRINALN